MRVLVDTSALVALVNSRDQWHERAVRAARANTASGVHYVSTVLVLAEFHARLMYLRRADHARRATTSFLDDPAHEWLDVDSALVGHAMARWLLRFADQPFSMTDAVSFEVMRRERIKHAFAFDRHFETAGFTLLE